MVQSISLEHVFLYFQSSASLQFVTLKIWFIQRSGQFSFLLCLSKACRQAPTKQDVDKYCGMIQEKREDGTYTMAWYGTIELKWGFSRPKRVEGEDCGIECLQSVIYLANQEW